MQGSLTLRTETYAAAGTRHIPLADLPPGKRIRALHLYFALSGTKDAADALTGDNFFRALQRIQIGDLVNIAGESLAELNKDIYGVAPYSSTDIPGSGTTFAMEFGLVVPFKDPRQSGSDDGSMPCELLDTLSAQITWAAATFAGVGNLTVTAGSLYALAELVEETAIPQVNRLEDLQPNALTFSLPPGVYKSAFILDGGPNTNGSITAAEVSNVDMSVDGNVVFSSARHESIVDWYNRDTQQDAAGRIAVNAASRLPLVWHDRFGKSHISKQPAVEKNGQVRLTGTITAANVTFVSWRALPKSETAVKTIAAAIGEPLDGAQYMQSTSTKAPLGSLAKSSSSGRVPRKGRIAGTVLAGHMRRV